jgi:hypothetical protein
MHAPSSNAHDISNIAVAATKHGFSSLFLVSLGSINFIAASGFTIQFFANTHVFALLVINDCLNILD